ncbi:MAG TPA: helix-turn-helix domain-containing protein [Candidatus Aquilonibacter sp.]|nr:helix-turn-helix domain-containing protein [Candidatus Aquilonibacter sp.]
MALTRTFAAGREQCFQQIERLTNSHSLRGSESLCKLLRYLAEHSLAHPPSTVKEYQIATEVFGRSADFDPQADSTVRVQAGRLRIKLAEYYAAEGADDPIMVEVPKGSYVLSFHARTPGTSGVHAYPPLKVEEPLPRAASKATGLKVAVVVLSALLIVLLAAFAVVTVRGKSQAAAAPAVPPEFQVFWHRFIAGPEGPWLIFSNGAFVGRPETGMRYYNAATDAHAVILDHYTGVGEVLAVHDLDHVFLLLNHQLRVKRGTLFTLDDAKNNDLIFVGSPAENLTLLEIPGTQEFVFQRVESGPRKGDLGIANIHPQPGEPKIYLASPANQPTTEDYAVIALIPGLDPQRSVLILAGTTTMGTQAAAEYVSRPDSLAELLRRLNVSRPQDLRPFEALLRVKVTQGVPVLDDLVAVRKRK